MIIETCVVGVTATNCYLLINEETRETVVIDPGSDLDVIKSRIDKLDLKPVSILLTHGHFDHIMAANEMSEEYKIDIHASKEEETLLADPKLNCSSMIRSKYYVEADVLLEDQEVMKMAGLDIKVINTPGHTQGGVSYYIEEEGVLFCGDTLFLDSVGRTDFPTGDIRSLNNSIIKHLFTLPTDVKVYPGHGETTSIGHEKENNPFIKEYR